MSTRALFYLTLTFQAIQLGLKYSFLLIIQLTVRLRSVDGIKRFTGIKAVGGKGIRLNEVAGLREPEVSRNSTAALACQLLDPAVSEEEQAEYQGWALKFLCRKVTQHFFRYIDQYQGSLDWPSTTVERGDWDVYQISVMTAAGLSDLEDDLFWVYTEYTKTGSYDTSLFYDNWLNGLM